MRLPRNRLVVTSLVAVLAGVMAASLLAPIAVTAQGDTTDFDATLSAIRDEAQAAIDVASLAAEEGSVSMTAEQQLMGPVAANLPVIVSELRDYADAISALDAPPSRATDVSTHAARLGELADVVEDVAAAAAVGDIPAVNAGFEAAQAILVELASTLSPEYFDVGFVSTFRDRFESFKGLSEDDLAYLDGVRAAYDEFVRRNAEAGRNVFDGTVYVTPADMMRAFYDAGAGEAFPAVEAALETLKPTDRFADEHAWLLRDAASNARLDRQIRVAAEQGDAMGFMVINNRLALNAERDGAGRVYPEFDPAVGVAGRAEPLAARLEPSALIARDPYGVALFETLRNFSWTDPTEVATNTFFFPGVTIEMQMEAVARDADLYRELWQSFAAELRALEAPASYAADQTVMLDFLELQGAQLEDFLRASSNGEAGAIFPTLEAMRTSYCDASGALSDEIAPATTVYFDATIDLCR